MTKATCLLRTFKAWGAVLIALWVCLFSVSYAKSEQSLMVADISGLVPLSNEKLISIVRQTEYGDWLLYQPDSREETDMNTSTDSILDNVRAYPVVAVQNDEICLIVLEKINAEWRIAHTNESALVRKGLSLVDFSLAVSYSRDIQDVYFDFMSNESNESQVTLFLQLSSIYPSYFSSIHYDNISMVMNYNRGLTYEIYYPFLFSASYEINPIPYIDFGIDEFSLQQFPIRIQELLAPATVVTERSEAGLYIMPDETTDPIISLKNGESINVIMQESTDGWEMAFYGGQILFVHNDDIVMSREQ